MIQFELEQNQSLGQVWTPEPIAISMLEQCLKLDPDIKDILDPACGPGTFSRALINMKHTGVSLDCYDVDSRMVKLTNSIHKDAGLDGFVHHKNYLKDKTLEGKFDLVIMNPPYIRQEKIVKEDKEEYLSYFEEKLNCSLDKRSNLFAFFLIKAIVDLKKNGLLCAIVYDAIEHTSYGKKTISLLNQHCDLISEKQIHAPFTGAMVDAKVLIYRKRENISLITNHKTNICDSNGLIELEQLIDTRRGTGFSLRKLFIAESTDSIFSLSTPFFIKQAKLKGMIVEPDTFAYFIDPSHSESEIIKSWLISKASKLNIDVKKYVYAQISGEIIFNYYMRTKPRHLWNKNGVPVSDNFYVLKVKGDFPAQVAWLLLNSELYTSSILLASRNQGNGLSKIQLFEYKKVRVPDWRNIPERKIISLEKIADDLLTVNADYYTVKSVANEAIKGIFNE